MFVASRRIWPPNDGDHSPVTFTRNGDYGWKSVFPFPYVTADMLIPRLPVDSSCLPGPGSYRKFRLRCSYTDGFATSGTPHLQLQFIGDIMHPPPSPLWPEVLDLPSVNSRDRYIREAHTQFFTVGDGSASQIEALYRKAGLLRAQLAGTARLENTAKGELFEAVMEYWDFTCPDEDGAVVLPRATTLVRRF